MRSVAAATDKGAPLTSLLCTAVVTVLILSTGVAASEQGITRDYLELSKSRIVLMVLIGAFNAEAAGTWARMPGSGAASWSTPSW